MRWFHSTPVGPSLPLAAAAPGLGAAAAPRLGAAAAPGLGAAAACSCRKTSVGQRVGLAVGSVVSEPRSVNTCREAQV